MSKASLENICYVTLNGKKKEDMQGKYANECVCVVSLPARGNC